MDKKFKDIDINNRTYYFFDGMINIRNLDLNEIKIDEKSYKNILILISYIGYVIFKDLVYMKTNIVKSLYLTINKINGYFEEIRDQRVKSEI